MTPEAIKTIEAILKRGNDVQIQRKGDGIAVLEVKREIKYSTPSSLVGGKGNQSQLVRDSYRLAPFCCEVNDMDYNQEYIDLLKRSLAGETETVRLYLAVMAVAPNSAIPTLLEIQADETDHQARIADLLTEALAGQSADQEQLVPGVE